MNLYVMGIAAAAFLLVTAWGGCEHKRANGAIRDKEIVQGKFDSFKSQVEENGKKAEKEKKEKEAQDKKAKEDSDEKFKSEIARLHGDLKRLRSAAGNPAGGSVSGNPSGSKCPEGQTCFDKAEYQRAWGEIVSGIRSLLDEGSEIALQLQEAQDWCNKVKIPGC